MMYLSSIHSSSGQSILPSTHLASSSDGEISTIESNKNHLSRTAPYLPPEVIENILYFLIKPYEPFKSIFNLYAIQLVNKIFYQTTVNFLKNHLFNFSKIADKDIILLKKIKEIENDISGEINRENIEIKINAYHKLLQDFSNIKYPLNRICYNINFALEESKNVCVYFRIKNRYENTKQLEILSRRKNIENISIIANSTFSVDLSEFLGQLKYIFSNNKSISNVNYLSLRRSNINNDRIIPILYEALSGMTITTLDLSQNNILDKYSPILAKYLSILKIKNLHLNSIGISSKGLNDILNSLPKNLKYLNLSNNQLGLYGANLIFDKLRSSKTEIERINLSKIDLVSHPLNYQDIKNEKWQPIQFEF